MFSNSANVRSRKQPKCRRLGFIHMKEAGKDHVAVLYRQAGPQSSSKINYIVTPEGGNF